MSRSGYSDDGYNYLWPSIVKRATEGKRGQAFLQELADAMDAMPAKRLITGELVTFQGECCTIGVVCKARRLDVKEVELDNPHQVGELVGISAALAADIEYYNDEVGINETPEQRWTRMRQWVAKRLK